VPACSCAHASLTEPANGAVARFAPAAIAKLLLPGRSNTAVKNFWHCRLKSGAGCDTNK
jgi:hypothetical protein